jgi:hypothetical protein
VGKIKGPHGPLCNNIATAVLLCALTNAAKVTVLLHNYYARRVREKAGSNRHTPLRQSGSLPIRIFSLYHCYINHAPLNFVFLLLVPIHITLPLTLF